MLGGDDDCEADEMDFWGDSIMLGGTGQCGHTNGESTDGRCWGQLWAERGAGIVD